MSKKYISVDSSSNITQEQVKMQNRDNEICGTLKIVDGEGENSQLKDIKDVFIKKDVLNGIDAISEPEEGKYSLEEMVEKYNELINALKGITSVVLAMFCIGAFGADAPEGKEQLRYIKGNQHVVTNEVDSVFKGWLTNDVFIVTNKTEVHFGVENPTNDFYINDRPLGEIIKQTVPSEKDPKFEREFKNIKTSIGAGYGTLVDSEWSGWKSLALGTPGAYTSNYYGNNDDFVFDQNPNKNNRYRYDFMGPAVAFRDSVALGSAAQARSQVSIAIGVGAIVANLHGLDGTKTIGYVQDIKTITTTYDASDNIVNVTTNMSVITNFSDVAIYESLPQGKGTFPSVANYTTTNIVEGGKIVTATYLENLSTGAIDPSFATEDEMQMYDFSFNSGQDGINYKDGIYGVAIGYRSMAVAFHTLALGHYARAYRPHAVAVGPSSHIKSEGSVGLGYINTIETNSPFCLAVGSNTSIDPGMTNAIVIGVPPVDFSRRFAEGYKTSGSPYVYQRGVAKAMKSNSINFVFNGEGLKDVFVDDVPITDRMASEINIVGNTPGARGETSKIVDNINQLVGIPSDDKSIVFVSGGGVKIFTEQYLDDCELASNENERKALPHYGDVSQIEINGKKLSEILAECSNDAFNQYHATVTNAAAVALESITTNTNFSAVKETLKTFFQSIK